jgi:hypothetical protein
MNVHRSPTNLCKAATAFALNKTPALVS